MKNFTIKKTLLSAVCFIVFTCVCFAQDIIITKDARRINAKVTEVNVDNVRYKNFDNQDGPIYTILKNNIASILYQNGQVETFETVSTTPSAPAQTTQAGNSIASLDAKELNSVLSIGFEIIYNYLEASAELDKTLRLLEHFSESAKKVTGSNPIPSELAALGMTQEELGAEIVKRIGPKPRGLWMGDHSLGFCTKGNAKIIEDMLTQELEEWETKFDEAEKALEENIKIVELIPPDYRYPLALKTMLGFISNYRASNWKECADLYAEWIHRMELEKKVKTTPPVIVDRGKSVDFIGLYIKAIKTVIGAVEKGGEIWGDSLPY